MKKYVLIAAVLFVGLSVLTFESLVIVRQHTEMIVLQFGEPKKVSNGPGLYTKLPFVQNVVFYDMRIMCFEVPTEQVITSDKKRLMVDAHVVYKVSDPVAFYKRLRTHDLACQRLHALTVSALRGFVGQASFEGFLKDKRQDILDNIRQSLIESTKDFGVDIIDVRVSKAELPIQNSQAIYRRMISERTRIAKQVRAEGQEKAVKMKATAEKEAAHVVADARTQAVKVMAEGKAYACRKHNEMARKDKKLFKIYKGAKVSRKILENNNVSQIVLDTKEGLLSKPLQDTVLCFQK